jgi:DNA-binding response OmpR family regulator
MSTESIAVRTLLVSQDVHTIGFLSQQMQQLAIEVDISRDAESAMGKLCRAKFEGILIDFELGQEAHHLLERLRGLTSHQHAISFAIVENDADAAAAFRAHANFTVRRPFSASSVVRTFRASYPMMFREKRRYYRYAVAVRTYITSEDGPEFVAESLNISETGMAISSSATVRAGSKIRLKLELPAMPEPVLTSAEICWANENGRAGLRFIDVNPELTERLQLWLLERMSELVPAQ